MTSSNKRTALSPKQKKEICLYIQNQIKWTQQSVADIFSQKWNISVSRRVIGDIWAGKESWLAVDISNALNSLKKKRPAALEELEEELYSWFLYVRSQNIPLNDAVVIEKAVKLSKGRQISEIKFSVGWFTRLKQRFGISSKKLFGESAGADNEAVTLGRETAVRKIREYEPDHVYNCDETALNFEVLPDKSLPTRRTIIKV